MRPPRVLYAAGAADIILPYRALTRAVVCCENCPDAVKKLFNRHKKTGDNLDTQGRRRLSVFIAQRA